MHDHISHTHFGVHKTFNKVKQRYWWKGMYKDVEHWSKSCTECSMRKSPWNIKKAPLLPIPGENAFDRVAVDVLGPFPPSNKGNRYVVIFSDYLTGWCEAFPVPSVEATVISRLLVNKFIARHGAPRVLLSDRGKNFLSKVVADVSKVFHIHKVNTSSYHPQTDGSVERFNSTLCQSLSKYVAKNQKDWDDFIPLVLFAHRTSILEAIGDSPYYVLYGHEPRLPVDVKYLPPVNDDVTASVFEHHKRIVENIELAQNLARENLQRAQQKMKDYYDQNTKEPVFELGQRVWIIIGFFFTPTLFLATKVAISLVYHSPKTIKCIQKPKIEKSLQESTNRASKRHSSHRTYNSLLRTHNSRVKKGLSRKLLHNWLGPYRIVEQSSPVHFHFRTDTNKKVTFAVHANRMKPFIDPSLRPIEPPLVDDPSEPYLDESDIPDDCFESEVLLNKNVSPKPPVSDTTNSSSHSDNQVQPCSDSSEKATTEFFKRNEFLNLVKRKAKWNT
ncbi:Retrovirus-related Pol polyprotein [Stylophora pistillata]|uniref:Retrovirus-related Pol polyprotein n=1 Tax=Stylophora pistillata TaxID=50429 RepID=A0A2B4RIG3_STYPI|nr:Retrovirus-related Pol polyprotein [Stylophora pistillata]